MELADPKDFIVESDAGGLRVGFIVTARKNTPLGLRKPYEYIAAEADVLAAKKKLKEIIKSKTQYDCVWFKKTKYGAKLKIFVCDLNTKITEEFWIDHAKSIQQILYDLLGDDAKLYVEPWKNTRPRIQMRYETYIKYKET